MVSDKLQDFEKVFEARRVLILVLMEYGLGPHFSSSQSKRSCQVLILVLMEYGLGQPKP